MSTIDFQHHPRQLPKFSAQMAVAVKTALKSDLDRSLLRLCLSIGREQTD